MNGLVIDTSGGNCPLQIEGTIDGVEFYFRARGRRWTMGIGGDVVIAPDWSMSGPWGEGAYGAGWMPEHIGQAIVAKCCEVWQVARYAPNVVEGVAP